MGRPVRTLFGLVSGGKVLDAALDAAHPPDHGISISTSS